MSKKRAKATKPHRHRYGGYIVNEPSEWLGETAMLRCADCGEEYVPQSAFTCEPIDAPIYDCPHPTFGPSRWSDDEWVRQCLVCRAQRRFTPVRCIGGPYDGRVEPTLLGPEDGTSWEWRYLYTSEGQEPDENGSTLLFSYTLRFGSDGLPYWEGRSQAERALDAHAAATE